MKSRNNIVALAALAALVVFEAAVVYMIATPNVSEQYRAYFIERTTDCWPRNVSGEIALGERVWFLKADAKGAANNLTLCGWTPAAGTGTWSVGPQSRLRLDAGGNPGPLTLELDLFPYVRDSHPLQRVALSANGRQLAELALNAESKRLHVVEIPPDAIGADGRIDLIFDFPDAQSPRALGISDDGRRFAIRLVSLRLLSAGGDAGPPPPA